jgi:hypothetical protein
LLQQLCFALLFQLVEVAYAFFEEFVNSHFSVFHAGAERTHESWYVVLSLLLNHRLPLVVNKPEAEAIKLEKGALAKTVQFAEFLELYTTSHKFRVLWRNITCVHVEVDYQPVRQINA